MIRTGREWRWQVIPACTRVVHREETAAKEETAGGQGQLQLSAEVAFLCLRNRWNGCM